MKYKTKFLTILALLLMAVTQGARAASGIYCTDSDVGRVLCTDGSIYDNVAAATAAGRTAVAKIIYLDQENNKGWALALQDEAKITWYGVRDACSNKNTSIPVAGATWKLASKDEWQSMISHGADNHNAFRVSFSGIGGTDMEYEEYYWLNTESYSKIADETYSYIYKFAGNEYKLIWQYDTNIYRACLEFNLLSLYTIGSAAEWTAFCNAVNGGSDTFSDKYVKLTQDISVSAMMAGTSETNSFQGVFDGSFNTTNGTTGCGGFVGWHNNATVRISHSLYAPSGSIPEGWSAIDNGATFVRGGSPTITNCYYTGTLATEQATQAYAYDAAPANLGDAVADGNYGYITAYQNGLLYGGTYYVAPAAITLTDDATDNGTAISAADGYAANVTLQGRTLYRDGDWNTLCLPFSVANLSGTPLDGATLMTLSTTGTAFDASTGTLTLNFEPATAIEAGRPYIVKWATTGDAISSPVFSGLTISSTAADVETSAVTFKGNYDHRSFSDEDRSILFLGNGNTLYYPLSGATIGACRAYFQLNGDITAGDPAAQAAPVRAFVLHFGDDSEATGILSLTPDPSPKGEGSEYWYTLDGRRLAAQPSRAGVYIYKGIKRVIK